MEFISSFHYLMVSFGSRQNIIYEKDHEKYLESFILPPWGLGMIRFRLPPGSANAVIHQLLPWFSAHGRDLPWRQDRSPYSVWISEAMLQQTRVDTVIAYYQRWMKRFPDVVTLAAAEQGEVLKVWEGLGYYARARNLHRAAKVIVSEHGGRIPSAPDVLLTLPGIGLYTQAAIASLAFGHPLPVLDGNVERVLTRICAIEAPLGDRGVRDGLRTLAGRLMPKNAPGAFNEAMMELGATVCLPRAPRCGECPLASVCRGQKKNPLAYPVKAKKAKIPTLEVGAAVTWREDGRFLIARRHEKGLLGGMWEFPGGKQESGESMPDCIVRELQEELGITVQVQTPLTHVRHTYSHFHLSLHVWNCRWQGDTPKTLDCADFRWVTLAECRDLPFGKADRQVFPELEAVIA